MATRYLITSIREHWGETKEFQTEAVLQAEKYAEMFPDYKYSIRPVTDEEVALHTAPTAPTKSGWKRFVKKHIVDNPPAPQCFDCKKTDCIGCEVKR
jgi:hypothetical protein